MSATTRRAVCVAAVAGLSGALTRVFAQSDSSEAVDFLHGLDEYEHIRRMLPEYMAQKAQSLVQLRKEKLKITNLQELEERRNFARERILHAIGGLPERTPLNARVVETLTRDGYRIEKVIFESQPKFFVTANLYLPAEGSGPRPAILYPLGHELGGKSNPTWQQMLATLARKGYVALTWDPVGQGERVQLYSASLRDSFLRSSTTEHTMLGGQCLLTGQHIARYTIWDGIRALDYLLSRPEVDVRQVAITGNSGGGTHSAYIGALDDRIKVVAPSCFITSWHWMLKTLGPQDAEQVFPGWLGDGLDYADFVYAASPKPYFVLSAIRDFFPIDGARETFREAEHTYKQLESKNQLAMFEADDGHGYLQPRRAAAYNWLSVQLRNKEDHEPEIAVAPESAEALFCTTTGQVATSLGGETVFTLNRARAQRLRENRPKLPADTKGLVNYQDKIRQSAQKCSGYLPGKGPVLVTPYGTIKRRNVRIEKLTYESEPGIFIPALLYVPESGAARKPAVILADGEGKSGAAMLADQLATSGVMVLSVDLRGMGETRIAPDLNDSESYRYFGDYEDAMTAILMNGTLAGMRARDLTRGLDVLSLRPDVDPDKLCAIGRGSGAVHLLYAALFDQRLKALSLEGMLISYHAVTTTEMHRLIFEQIVPGALIEYDLPDLIAALAPRKVWISNPVTPTNSSLPHAEMVEEYSLAARAYALSGVATNLHLQPDRPEEYDGAQYYRGLFQN